MAIDTEGVRVRIDMEALAPSEGFVIKVNTNMSGQTTEERNAIRKGQELKVFDTRLNKHVPDFSTAVTEVGNAVNSFATDITSFISDWNNGVIEGSPTYTGSSGA